MYSIISSRRILHADEGGSLFPSLSPAAPVPATELTIAPHRSGRRFMAIVLVTVSLIATSFLFLSYYAVQLRHRRWRRRYVVRTVSPSPDPDDYRDRDGAEEFSAGDEYQYAIRSRGLDEAEIQAIPFFKYRRESGAVGGSACSICLDEFVEGGVVRVLPRCGHIFHVSCIDSWLQTGVCCPLCRASVVDAAAAAAASATASSSVYGSESVASALAAISGTGPPSSPSQILEVGRERGVTGPSSSSILGTGVRVLNDVVVCGGNGESDDGLHLRRSVSMDTPATDGLATETLESEIGTKQGDCVEEDSSPKDNVEMERSASNSEANSFFTTLRGRSTILPL